MAELRTFHGALGAVTLEVESGSAGASGGGSLADLMAVLLDVASAAVGQLQRIDEDKRPSELEIRFGLKGLSDGGVALTQEQEKANFQVRMKWAGGGAPAVPKP